MASINDILFTRLSSLGIHAQHRQTYSSNFGTFELEFSSAGLLQMHFLKQPIMEPNLGFQSAFMNWLAAFSQQSAEQQWSALAARGTEFQQTVWRSLLQIPLGKRVNYHHVAESIGRPKATRAVATALAANPICLLIPCHRVVPKAGGTGRYRWGDAIKQTLLTAEVKPGAALNHFFQ
jgi:O-6-methylguanine DNA methyltransferase